MMRNTLLRTALILAAASLSACAGAGIDMSGSCGLQEHYTLPLDMMIGGRAPVLWVRVNGIERHFLFDTGAATSAIERRTALALGLLHDTKTVNLRDVTGTQNFDSIEIERVETGGLAFEHKRFVVSNGLPYDGVIGLDLLQDYTLDINELEGRIVAYRGRLCAGQKPTEDAKLIEMPAIRGVKGAGGKPTPHLEVATRINGTLGLAMFDTGAIGGSLVSPKFAEKAGVTKEMIAADPEVHPRGFGAVTSARLHRFDQVDLDAEIFPKPVLLISSDPGMAFNVVIGADYFHVHRVWFDFANDRVFALPLEQLPPPGS